MPAASHVEKSGTFTNTQRLLQWWDQAVEPPGDQRSELWFFYHLGWRLKEKLAGSADERDRPLLDLAWDYATEGDEPSGTEVLRHVSGIDLRTGRAVDGYLDLRADGSTSCCWICARSIWTPGSPASLASPRNRTSGCCTPRWQATISSSPGRTASRRPGASLQPLLDHPPDVRLYPRGSWGPDDAEALVRGHPRWQPPWLPADG